MLEVVIAARRAFFPKVYSYISILLLIFFAEKMENTVLLSTTSEKFKIHGFLVNTKYST